MRSLILLALLFLFNISNIHSQGGWSKITDPQNAVSLYTTIFPYVGVSFIDINNDNLPDIHAAPQKLFLNQGNGRYISITGFSYNLLNGTAGSTWADIDNDGDNDCIIAGSPSKVYLNNGTGSFANGTPFFPDLSTHNSWGAAIGDLDENRGLDVVFAHANGYHPNPEPCRFYYQPDSVFGNFAQLTGYPFLQQLNSYTNPFWSDYDLDGDMDLFIASGPVNGIGAQDPCYKNMKIELGEDTLIKMTTELFAQQIQDGQCYNFIDYDNDGDFDLCLTNYYSAPTRMYRNDGGIYTSLNTQFTTATTNIANCWGDYDNDGDQDVIITNDNAITRYYRNDLGTFNYLPNGLTTPTATNGVSNADYDNDGDLDVFFNGIGNNGNTSSVGLYKNDTVAGNRKWVNLKLTGTISNKSAIGAIVKLKAVINGIPVWQLREVNAQNSFQGQNDLRVHFGLGNAQQIDSIIIKWPKGLTEVFTNVDANRFYNAVEGAGLSEIIIGITQISTEIPGYFRLEQNYPNPFNPSTKIRFSIPEIANNHKSLLIVYDIMGREIETLLDKSLTAGTYEAEFNAAGYSSGVYFYQLTYGNFSETKKMILLK